MNCLLALLTIAAIILTDETVTGEGSATQILGRLLHKYNRRELPRADAPTKVRLGLHVDSIHSISESSMDYSMNVYLRQAWWDPRLSFDGSDLKVIRLADSRWNRIWQPDTFVGNGKGESFHSVTVPNRLVEFNATGHVWYVTKISMTLSCPMKLQKFPFDTQSCRVTFESFGYDTSSMYYAWLDAPVYVDPRVQLPSFTLHDVIHYDCNSKYATAVYPCLGIKVLLKRDIGYYIMQYDLPTMGLVILSWLTFWFPVDATPARAFLLLMPVICMSLLWNTIQSLLATVSYIKAIDVWMIGCEGFVFVAMLELSLVNVMMKPQSGSDSQPSYIEQGDGLLDMMGFSGGSKVSKIDRVYRAAIPLAYLLFIIVYFVCYLA